MAINLKKYNLDNLDNLKDYEITYVKVDDTENFKYYLNVLLNNKLIGSIHVDHKSDGRKTVSFKTIESSPIHSANYYQDVDKIKAYIEYEIEKIINFILYNFTDIDTQSPKTPIAEGLYDDFGFKDF